MVSPYGVVERGTSEERLMLWCPDQPIIEINLENPSALPMVTLSNQTGLGETVAIEFAKATQPPFHLPKSNNLTLDRQIHGWYKALPAANRPLSLIDPSLRYSFHLEMVDDHLAIYLEDFTSDEGPWSASLESRSL